VTNSTGIKWFPKDVAAGPNGMVAVSLLELSSLRAAKVVIYHNSGSVFNEITGVLSGTKLSVLDYASLLQQYYDSDSTGRLHVTDTESNTQSI